METEIYKNNYDDVQLSNSGLIALDYAGSGDAAEIDRGIRDCIKGIRLSILAMGLGLAKIRVKSLYRDLGYQNMSQYIQRLCDDTKMDRSSIYNWLYIGDAYIKYQNDLEQIGFNDSDGPTKLPYLERALETNEKQNVFDNIKNMTVREFAEFSKGSPEEVPGLVPFVKVRRGRVYAGGKLAVKINRRLDKRTYNYLRKIMCIAGKAMEEGDLVFFVRLRNRDEMRRYEQSSKQLISKLRKDN